MESVAGRFYIVRVRRHVAETNKNRIVLDEQVGDDRFVSMNLENQLLL